LKIPLEERLRCEQILNNTTLSKQPFEIVLGAPSKNMRGKRRWEVAISAASKSSNLQTTLATSIRKPSKLDDSKWEDDWILEPIIWMGISLSKAKALEIMMALNNWHTTSDPMKLRVVGLGMEYSSRDGETLSRYSTSRSSYGLKTNWTLT
jgi:hypothetical protein